MKTKTALKHQARAAKIALVCNLVLLNNGAHAVHRFVKRYTWTSIFLVAITSLVTSYCNIHQARAERDILAHQNYQLQQSVDSLKIMIGK